MTKEDLDREVAKLAGVPLETVRLVTSEFVAAMARALVDGEDVLLRNLGGFHYKALRQTERTLRGNVIGPCTRYLVAFRSSLNLRRALRERYGDHHER